MRWLHKLHSRIRQIQAGLELQVAARAGFAARGGAGVVGRKKSCVSMHVGDGPSCQRPGADGTARGKLELFEWSKTLKLLKSGGAKAALKLIATGCRIYTCDEV